MSSLYDDPQLTQGLLEQCLDLLAEERLYSLQSQRLSNFNQEAYFRGGGSFPKRLAILLKERSRGKFTTLAADSIIVPYPLKQAVYFVRTPTDTKATEPVVELREGMILCEINPYTRTLTVCMPANSPEKIRALCKEKEVQGVKQELQRVDAQQRRMRVLEARNALLSRLETCVERSNDEVAYELWNKLRTSISLNHGRIDIDDVYTLCDVLGIDMHILTDCPPE